MIVFERVISSEVDALLVEVIQHLQELLQRQLGRSQPSILQLLQHLNDLSLELPGLLIAVLLLHLLALLLLLHLLLLVLHADVSQQGDEVFGPLSFLELQRLLLQDLHHLLVLEGCCKGLVLADEADAKQSVPLEKIDIRKGILRLYSYDAALDLRRRLEVVLSDLDEVVYLRQ